MNRLKDRSNIKLLKNLVIEVNLDNNPSNKLKEHQKW